MKLSDASKLLSQKLYDPVLNGNDAGRLYSVEMRSNYINNAMKSLVRILLAIHHDLPQVIKDYFQITVLGNILSNATETSISIVENSFPIGVYFAENSTDEVANKRARKLDQVDYYDSKINLNTNYIPESNARYWTVINNKIYFLPEKIDYYKITLLTNKNFKNLTSDDELPFDSLYDDMIIILAAQEGMTDKGNTEKYNLYSQMIADKIKLITFRSKVIEQEISNKGKLQ